MTDQDPFGAQQHARIRLQCMTEHHAATCCPRTGGAWAADAIECLIPNRLFAHQTLTQWPRWVDFCRNGSSGTVCCSADSRRSLTDQAPAVLRPVTLQASDLS